MCVFSDFSGRKKLVVLPNWRKGSGVDTRSSKFGLEDPQMCTEALVEDGRVPAAVWLFSEILAIY